MIVSVLASLLVIFILLVVTEFLWRSHKLNVETSRKIVHMGTGVLIAAWPLFLTWSLIQLLALVMLLVVLVSYKLDIFKSIHSVDRPTRGEILYPIGIGICALLEPAPWMFAAAVLHLALADGLAALVGIKYGQKTRYTLFSHGKSLAGSVTFMIVSFTILLVTTAHLPHPPYLWLAWSALVLTLIENISWYGLDDITVPVSVIVILTLLPV